MNISPKPQQVGTFTLAMLTVAAVISLRNLPLFAIYGLSAFFYLSLAALLFLIPIALVTAELATTWPKAGGNYHWVSQAFGKRWGFVALWAAWMESIAWFPAILAFIAHMFALAFKPFFPSLVHSMPFHFLCIIAVFWGTTLINFKGIETSGWLSSVGVVLGTLIPGLLILGLALAYLWVHPNPLHAFEGQTFIPSWKPDSWVLLGGMLLSFAGAELGAFHIGDTKNPQQAYPRALLISVVMILVISIFGALAIAMVVPINQVDLVAGLIQAYEVFLNTFNMSYLTPGLALLLALGSLAGVNAWVLGPAKGMLVTAQEGFLPPWLQHTNAHGVPTRLLMLQAIIGTGLSLVFFCYDETSVAYWILTALSTQFTVTQYALVFLSAWRLRTTYKLTSRPFAVPGGSLGMGLVCLSGLVICLFGFIIVFQTPVQLPPQNAARFAIWLAICFIVLLIPSVLLKPKKRV